MFEEQTVTISKRTLGRSVEYFDGFYQFMNRMLLIQSDLWIGTSKISYDTVDRKDNIEIPGQYWMLQHIMPEAIMYVPSYLLAAVRAAEQKRKIEEMFGQNWWKLKEAGT